ncbi:M [Kumasi rhabdovirus]|uniref:M n=1 Tax=Kumasi rhabdovirus TaxID=1537975 RepID=A0A0C4MIT7_9RHAB|nr:M [Kumasi rhabdovirus] [Kumasi rhabdovirus]AIL31436.1 M [Kumasi rhabdovirus] [Kumasi rhabdovirus]
MIRLFHKKKGKEVATLPDSAPVASEDIFSAPPEPVYSNVQSVCTHVMRVQAKFEMRCWEEMESFTDCKRILEIWVDEAKCPIWQFPINSWLFYCLGVHARQDVTCTSHFVYKAQIDEVIMFHHDITAFDPDKAKAVTVAYDTSYKGRPCEVKFWCAMTHSKRRGVPFNVLYQAPLRNGSPPPPLTTWGINLPFSIKVGDDDREYIST